MLEELLARVAGRFGRVEPRRRVRGFVLGLLADLPRKNCWTIAEHAGLGELVRVAGRRWTTAKGLAGFGDHQLRRWLAWRRWTLLAMLAHALLAVIAATEHTEPAPDKLITLTCNEIQHLFTRLIIESTRQHTDPLAWSRWRRRHQHHSRASHYRRQQTQVT